MKAKRTPKPTIYETKILSRIAQSFLMKTRLPSRAEPVWHIDGYGEISDKCARNIIRKGFVLPQRDGLSMFDESQTYRAQTPTRRSA